MGADFVIKGNLCFSLGPDELSIVEQGYAVCVDGICKGTFSDLPGEYRNLPVEDYGDFIILPGLTDLHVHAPQYTFWGLGMDLELIDWLNQHTFPEETKYSDLTYAEKAYRAFTEELRRGPNTRAVVFATCHTPATLLLMDLLEGSGLATMAGRVNMDRNATAGLQESSAEVSLAETKEWLRTVREDRDYKNTTPILTPRFVPSCSDDLLNGLAGLQRKYGLPVQSHLSENRDEVEWVKSLHPSIGSYSEVYDSFGLFGGDAPTVMAHCVWMSGEEMELMRKRRVFAAFCPQSNMNLSSGIAPVRKFLDMGIPAGLGSDVAGGCHTSIFRAMSDAIQVSKLYWRLVDQECKPLTLEEAFYLGTMGGGAFFGDVGSFLPGYEFDALVIDDGGNIEAASPDIAGRLARIVYRPDRCAIVKKYVRGKSIL